MNKITNTAQNGTTIIKAGRIKVNNDEKKFDLLIDARFTDDLNLDDDDLIRLTNEKKLIKKYSGKKSIPVIITKENCYQSFLTMFDDHKIICNQYANGSLAGRLLSNRSWETISCPNVFNCDLCKSKNKQCDLTYKFYFAIDDDLAYPTDEYELSTCSKKTIENLTNKIDLPYLRNFPYPVYADLNLTYKTAYGKKIPVIKLENCRFKK